MAISAAVVEAGTYRKAWNVTATADADTTFNLAHGYAGLDATSAPKRLRVIITPILAQARLSAWIVGNIDGTNVQLVKDTAAGSGNATEQLMVQVELVHSIQR